MQQVHDDGDKAQPEDDKLTGYGVRQLIVQIETSDGRDLQIAVYSVAGQKC